VVFSLAVGTVLEAAIGPYQGKQTSELALLRLGIGQFQAGDIMLADRFFCSYWVIAALQARGVDVVVRLHQARKADFRRGRRLGREDHIVTWTKPKHVPDWMSRLEYDAMPAQITIRELRIRVKDKTKRVRSLVIVTTLVDSKIYKTAELGGLFGQRWHAELDLRTLKSEMRMEMLRTKSPEMVRKEVAMHLLAYNLIRGIMAEAARAKEIKPRTISFTGSLHTVRAFEASHLYDPERIEADLPRLLELIGKKRVGAASSEASSEAIPAIDDAAEGGQTTDQTRDNTVQQSIESNNGRQPTQTTHAKAFALSSCHSCMEDHTPWLGESWMVTIGLRRETENLSAKR
jgi:putative transposase